MNPYLVLGVPQDADDACIRRAYLDAIREATPEKAPARFKEIAAAYEKIKDETSRHHHTLFNTESLGDSPLDVFLQYTRLAPRPAPLPLEAMKDLLRSCSKP